MDSCCESKAGELAKLRSDHGRVLKVVLVLNAGLFVIEATAAIVAHSTALLADSADMLGDALVYGFSLYVLSRSAEWKSAAAVFKGLLMALCGFGVLAKAVHQAWAGIVPIAETMGLVGALVLAGNATCYFLLYRHRSDDLNMRSTWLCSRNDIIANLSVLGAAAGVNAFEAAWPDLLVGAAIAALFLRSALMVLREALRELQAMKLGAKELAR
ncbi:MAG TPA: cation transporter [Candidatus Eisenbacteria bacterium]|nr:cation transporter [Candidatus Eisenbacteria bacterium]